MSITVSSLQVDFIQQNCITRAMLIRWGNRTVNRTLSIQAPQKQKLNFAHGLITQSILFIWTFLKFKNIKNNIQRKIIKKISEKKHNSSAFRKSINEVFHFLNKTVQDTRKTTLLSKILYIYIACRWKTLSMQFNSKLHNLLLTLFFTDVVEKKG